MNTPFFDDFLEASSLDKYSVRAFAEQMNTYEADAKELQLEYPQQPTLLPNVRSSLSSTAHQRKSERTFSSKPLTKRQIATILSAGRTIDGLEHRTYPAAGAQYCVELFHVLFHAGELSGKILYYDAARHGYHKVPVQAPSWSEAQKALNIEVTGTPQSLVLLVCFPERVTAKYGERGGRFALFEAGALMQQLSLTIAADRQLKGVAVGGTLDEFWKETLGLVHTRARVVLGYLVGR